MSRIRNQITFAMGFRAFAKALRVGIAKHTASALLLALLFAFFAGCATQNGAGSDYRADTTPEHNGENWIGGK